MKKAVFFKPLKTGLQILLLLTITGFYLGIGSVKVASAEETAVINLTASPPNDDFDHPALIDNITYVATQDTTGASPTPSSPTSDDPDAIYPCSTVTGDRSLNAGGYSVWYTYTPPEKQSISLDTLDSTYDTYIAVFTGTRGALNLVKCDDDTFEALTSELSFTALQGTTYYIEIASYSGTTGFPREISPAGTLQFHAYITTTSVTIGTNLMGKYYVPQGSSIRRSYAGIDSGPVQINNTVNIPIIAAMRAVWILNGQYSSYSELMGLPKEQLSTDYYFPWYNNNATTLLDEQFRFANVDTTATTVEVSVGTQVLGTYPLGPGQSLRKSFAVDNGPIRIRSLDGKKIIAAMRAVWILNGQYSSYSELMGLPKEQLSTDYYFPWYNNAATSVLDEQLRFGAP